MEMIGKVRRMKLRDKLSHSAIAKATGLSRTTVKKWLKAPGDKTPKYVRKSVEGKLTAFEETLDQSLSTDAYRSKHGRRSGRALFKQIQAQGYRGGYSVVTNFIRAWREKTGKSSSKAFVPLSFELGEAFQFDWSDEGLVVAGIFYKVQVSHLKLCASRAFWLVAYPSQGHEMLFDAHTRSFQALGGVTRRGIYDNMKTAVDKVKKGKGRIVNARFAAMCSHYLFDPDFCNVASGWEKGVVEKNVQDSRRRIWIEAGTRRFGSFIELNVWLGERCRSIWADTQHPVHQQFSVAEMLELERPHLMNMPAPFDGYVEKSARVSRTCLVAVARNRYSVPCEWAGYMVSTRLYPNSIAIAADDTIVASHSRMTGSGQTNYDWQHYIDLVQRKPGALRNGAPFLDMPEPLLRLRQSLLRHAGGDRVMADVLAMVPQAARRANVTAMRWADIDLAACVWRIVKTKNGTPQTVTLSPEAVTVLESRKADGEFVFPGEGKTKHIVEPKKAWATLLKAAGIENLRIHDLRRTLGSWQARTGASLPIIGKSLNHKTHQATAIYARLDLDPVRQSVNTATTAMMEAAGLKKRPELVVPIEAAKT